MIISNGTSTMDTQCSSSSGTQSTTTNTDISNVNSTAGNSSTPISPNNKGNKNFQKMICLVYNILGKIHADILKSQQL